MLFGDVGCNNKRWSIEIRSRSSIELDQEQKVREIEGLVTEDKAHILPLDTGEYGKTLTTRS